MANDKDKKRIGGVKSTKGPGEVEETGAVGEIQRVSKTEGVGRVGGVGGVGKGRLTRKITMAEREELFRYINEEAEKLLKGGAIPESQRELVKEAVKMAVDSGLIDEDEKK